MGKIATRILDVASGRIFYPFWSRRDGGVRMPEYHRLECSQWKDISNENGRAALEIARYAYQHCDFYKGRGPAPRTMADFQALPILTKDDVRRHGDALFSDEHSKDNAILNKTGGSTGVSLRVYCDLVCQQKRNAASILSDTWSGWKPGEVRGALWGNPPVPKGWKAVMRGRLLDRLIYLDTIEMNAASMDRFIDQLMAQDVHTLYGHAHSLFVFANHVAARQEKRLTIKSIISTSMVLLPNERRRIEEVFGCPVTDRYGCEEVSLIASECEKHHGLHANLDHIYLEILRPDGTPAAPGEEGAVVVTELINHAQPLIRYAVGDVAVRARHSCPCGRKRPLLERVVGRTADFLVRADGSLVAGVSLVERTLTAIPGIGQMQIVQDRIDELTVNVVPDERFSGETERSLTNELQKVFGSTVAIRIQKGDRLEQERNGKYRFAICRVATQYQGAAR